MMTINELNKEQIIQIKERMLDDECYEKEKRGASYGELAEADSLVSDEEVREHFKGTVFSEEDFL
jgi:hypothetical protein